MTETEWLECTDPKPMLEFLRDKASDRKLRLFAIACVLPLLHRISHEPGLEAVEVSERYADGLATEAELELSYERLDRRLNESDWVTADNAACAVSGACMPPSRSNHPFDIASYTASWTVEAGSPGLDWTQSDQQVREQQYETQRDQHRIEQIFHQYALLHDIFGNPFRPVGLDGPCITPVVLALAQTAYDNRNLPSGTLDNERLAVLADALEDSGATAAIIEHLRSEGPHVRGCFALDMLLGKM